MMSHNLRSTRESVGQQYLLPRAFFPENMEYNIYISTEHRICTQNTFDDVFVKQTDQ